LHGGIVGLSTVNANGSLDRRTSVSPSPRLSDSRTRLSSVLNRRNRLVRLLRGDASISAPLFVELEELNLAIGAN
jgi:hypothetical protein